MSLEGITKVLSNLLQQLLIQNGSTNFIGGSSTGPYSCSDTGVYFPTAAQFVIPYSTVTNIMHRVQQPVRNWRCTYCSECGIWRVCPGSWNDIC